MRHLILIYCYHIELLDEFLVNCYHLLEKSNFVNNANGAYIVQTIGEKECKKELEKVRMELNEAKERIIKLQEKIINLQEKKELD